MKPKLRSVILLSLCLYQTSCQLPSEDLTVDPELTHGAILAGGLALGGVDAKAEPLPDAERRAQTTILRRQLNKQRPAYPLVFSRDLVDRIGIGAYDSLLDEHRTTGLSPDSMLRLEGSTGARFLTLARIEEDRIYQRKRRESDDDDDRTYVATTFRSARVTLEVYDLQKQMVAWKGSVTKVVERSNRSADDGLWTDLFEAVTGADTDKARDDVGAWTELFESVTGVDTDEEEDAYPPYPPAPPLAEVTDACFAYLVNLLPLD